MRTTFAIDNNNHLVSAITPKADPMALKAGMIIKTTRDIALEPYGTIPKGACGTISDVWPENGTIAIRMCKPQPALDQLDNVLVLTPFDNEEDAEAFQVCHKYHKVANIAKRHILPRVAICGVAWGVWELYVQVPMPTRPHVEDIESLSTLAVFLATGGLMGIKAALSSA